MNTIRHVKKLYNGRENFLTFHKDYTRMVSDARYKPIYGERIKRLTPNQML